MIPQRTEVVHYITQPFGGLDWLVRANRMAIAAVEAITQSVVTRVSDDVVVAYAVVETPDNWFNDRGMDSKNAGDIQKLYWFVGRIIGQLQHASLYLNLKQIWTVIPKSWKGQTPKPIMVDRAMRRLELANFNLINPIPHDAAEAVLLAEIAGKAFRSNLKEGKGWARIWSSTGMDNDQTSIQVKTWKPMSPRLRD